MHKKKGYNKVKTSKINKKKYELNYPIKGMRKTNKFNQVQLYRPFVEMFINVNEVQMMH